jgi:hypothetical protein
MIGSLLWLIRSAAISAVQDGTEKITRKSLDAVEATSPLSPRARPPPEQTLMLPRDRAEKILTLGKAGWPVRAIAEQLGHSEPTIRDYLSGRTTPGVRAPRPNLLTDPSPAIAASASPRTRTCGPAPSGVTCRWACSTRRHTRQR